MSLHGINRRFLINAEGKDYDFNVNVPFEHAVCNGYN